MVKVNNWGSLMFENLKYDDYVIVLGESVCKDYYYVYGYFVENIFFMLNVNGMLIDGMIFVGINIIVLLCLMFMLLNKESWKLYYDLSLFDFVKFVGVKIYWVFN